jgi:L-methionine (R)-S-oxide reductase
MSAKITDAIASAVSSRSGRVEKARKVAELIRGERNYRWVGVYDVGPEMVSIIAFSGPSAPAYPQFPITKGLTGGAIREKKTVVVGDVRIDSRYLTAFGNTLSEIIIPVLDDKTGAVIGTIDVESNRANAFTPQGQTMLEKCEGGTPALGAWEGRLKCIDPSLRSG